MKKTRKIQRKRRIRARIFGTKSRPRLSVFRSNKFIYAQLIDDEKSESLVEVTDKGVKESKSKKPGTKIERANLVGKELAKKAKRKKISEVVFDRAGYRYHGRVRALAEGARKGGLKF